jgi:hypothetical protein
MRTSKLIAIKRKMTALALTGCLFALPFGSCDLGEFTATSTVTLDGRTVVQTMVRDWILTPVETFIDSRIDAFFDQFDDEEA